MVDSIKKSSEEESLSLTEPAMKQEGEQRDVENEEN
jgi:hypothetical protein